MLLTSPYIYAYTHTHNYIHTDIQYNTAFNLVVNKPFLHLLLFLTTITFLLCQSSVSDVCKHQFSCNCTIFCNSTSLQDQFSCSIPAPGSGTDKYIGREFI
jgi:hypothetical protein